VTDSGNLGGQALTFQGSTFVLNGDLSEAGIDPTTVNAAISGSDGTNAICGHNGGHGSDWLG